MGRFIRDALESVFAQTFKDYELLVIDDGSTDNTAEIIKEYAGRLQYVYKKNAGVFSALNVGVRLAKGDYLAFLDADDMWLPQKLEKQLTVIEERKAGFVYTAKLMAKADGKPTGEIRPTRPAKSLFDLLNNHYVNMSALVRKELVEQAGMFDESIESSGDTDFWVRVAKIAPFEYIDEPLLIYRLHGNNLSLNSDKRFAGHVIMFKKVLKDKDIKLPVSYKRMRLAQEYYWLSKALSEKKKFKEAAHALMQGMIHNVFLGFSFIEKQDRLDLKIKKMLNPIAAFMLYAAKSLIR